MGLRGPEVAFLGKKIAKISDFSKGDSDSRCHLLLSRPSPIDSTGLNYFFEPIGIVENGNIWQILFRGLQS